jgi:hypothetical protein
MVSELNIDCPGIKVTKPNKTPVSSRPITCGKPNFLQVIDRALDKNNIKAKGNNISYA